MKNMGKIWKAVKKVLLILILILIILLSAKMLTAWLVNTGNNLSLDKSDWIILSIVIIVIGVLIYAIYKMTKKKTPASSTTNSAQPHGGGGHGGGHDDHKPAKSFMHMFGVVVLIVLALLGGYYLFTSAKEKNDEREEVEKQAKLDEKFPTHTSSSELPVKKWKHKSDGTLILSPDFVIVFVKNPEDSFYAEMHGTDQKIAIEMDTTDILSKLTPAGKGNKEWQGMCVYAFQGVEGKITSIDYKFRSMSANRAETYIDTIFLKK